MWETPPQIQQHFSTMDSGLSMLGSLCPVHGAALHKAALSSAPIDMCTLAHYLRFPRAAYTHFLFMPLCARITSLLQPLRSKKQAITAIVCSTIHGIVKQAWEVNRIHCQGVTVLHMWEKYFLSSHQLHLYFKTEAHTV